MVSGLEHTGTRLGDEGLVVVTKIHRYRYICRTIADELSASIGPIFFLVSRANALIKDAPDEFKRKSGS